MSKFWWKLKCILHWTAEIETSGHKLWVLSIFYPTYILQTYNLLLTCSILTLWFISCRCCVKFNFGKNYLPSDSHISTVISDCFAYPSWWPRNRDKTYCSIHAVFLMVIRTQKFLSQVAQTHDARSYLFNFHLIFMRFTWILASKMLASFSL